MAPLLRSLCAGVGAAPDDLAAAVSGLTAPAAHVRGAALAALPAVPLLGEGAMGTAAAAEGLGLAEQVRRHGGAEGRGLVSGVTLAGG